MANGWYIVPYVRIPSNELPGPQPPMRGCDIRRFRAQIKSDGGDYRAVEILGNRGIVKVKGVTPATLALLDADFTRIPLALIDDPLNTLNNAQRNAIRNQILDCGYSAAEVTAAFPDIASKTLRDVLRFMATRRKKARYDQLTDSIVLDGVDQSCDSVDQMDTQL